MEKTIDIRQQVLAENNRKAEELRTRYAEQGTLVVNLISSPGSGKTTLLEAMITELKPRYRLGALEGDIATERDADRLRQHGIPAHQILTAGACHLDARQVHAALDQAAFDDLDLLLIENVGNLICPTSYDLGEDYKIALLSVAEGDDKPFKYPGIFSRAAVTVVTKADLLPHVDFAMEEVRQQVAALNPNGRFFVTSAKSGEGLPAWIDHIESEIAAKRAARPGR